MRDMFEMRTSAWALGLCAPGPPRGPQRSGPSAGIHPAAGTAVSSSIGARLVLRTAGVPLSVVIPGERGGGFRWAPGLFRCGAEQAGDVNETITTFCGPEEFRLHIRTLLVM